MKINDDILIYAFIDIMSETLIANTKKEIRARGLTIEKEEGRGFETTLVITSNDNEAKTELSLRNALLEIATIDRDEIPPKFDERLQDIDYYALKATQIMMSKIDLLERLLKMPSDENPHQCMEELFNEGGYERIQIRPVDDHDNLQE